ncbi:MAG: hypothetical protein RH862_01315 [Leptospiraceae bacterium]
MITNRIKTKRATFIQFVAATSLALGILLVPGTKYSEQPVPGERVRLEARADELQSLDPRQAKEFIRGLPERDAIGIYDLLVSEASDRGIGPQVFYLAEHIQTLRATEAAQKRLESLIWVLGLTLLLFAGYLTYVLIDQRRIYRKMLALKEARNSHSSRVQSDVYTGE